MNNTKFITIPTTDTSDNDGNCNVFIRLKPDSVIMYEIDLTIEDKCTLTVLLNGQKQERIFVLTQEQLNKILPDIDPSYNVETEKFEDK